MFIKFLKNKTSGDLFDLFFNLVGFDNVNISQFLFLVNFIINIVVIICYIIIKLKMMTIIDMNFFHYFYCNYYACELRQVWRINVNKYTLMTLILFSLYSLKKEEMRNKYEAHEVYFYYACVKYDVIGYMTSSCRDEWNQFLLL